MAQLAGTTEYTDGISTKEKDSSNEGPGKDNEQSDDEASVILEVWRMRSRPLLLSLSGLLWPEVVAPDRVLLVK